MCRIKECAPAYGVGVKVCGIKRKEDIEYVNRCLPDYIGFIFAESRRKITAERAASLCERLDDRIGRVGVFVNEAIDSILDTVEKCKLDVVQVHGEESPEYVCRLREALIPLNIWKAFRIKDAASVKLIQAFSADAFLLDIYDAGRYGGSGKSFNWELASEVSKNARVILAGGLNAENVLEAINTVRPFAVDVSSGVETDGYKDEGKIKAFIENVRKIKRLKQ